MNITAIIFAAVVVGGVGILIGFFLGVSGEKFKVEVDALVGRLSISPLLPQP
mgnify:CR=1 FL=1